MAKADTDDDEVYVPDAALEKLLSGLSRAQLCQVFKMHPRTLKAALVDVRPHRMRASVPLYTIPQVAPHLVKPKGDFEQYIKNANHMDLPKALTKEFWQGQRLKQQYMQAAGDLWPTQRVVAKVGELQKLVAMSARLFTDSVERNTELSDRQKSVLNSLVDGMLADLHRSITEHFKNPQPGDERAPDPSEEVGDEL